MVSSLRALLAGIIDYAGLFPPAKLPLDQAIQAYARYQRSPDSWMLGRFVCPAARLGELDPFIPELFSPDSPLRIAALGRGGKNAAEFLDGLHADMEAIGAFRDRHPERTEVGVYEVRLPGEILAEGSEVAAGRLLHDIARTLEQTNLPSMSTYYEAATPGAGRSSVTLLSAALAKDNRERARQGGRHDGPAGFKLRCGGLLAVDFPAPEQVAFAITACRDAGVPLKFTAGLHHPLRRFDPGLQTFVHGFLNILVGAVLAHAGQLIPEQLRSILEDEEPEHFAFAYEGLCWKDCRTSVAEIGAARRSVISFGSCSFAEPCDDLRAMGLLP